MTISELLGRLKVADPATWKEIFDPGYYSMPMELMTDPTITPCYPERWNDLIQGSIQRAIWKHTDIDRDKIWEWIIEQFALRPFAKISIFRPDADKLVAAEYGDTPAEAILSAYLTAISMEHKA